MEPCGNLLPKPRRLDELNLSGYRCKPWVATREDILDIEQLQLLLLKHQRSPGRISWGQLKDINGRENHDDRRTTDDRLDSAADNRENRPQVHSLRRCVRRCNRRKQPANLLRLRFHWTRCADRIVHLLSPSQSLSGRR